MAPDCRLDLILQIREAILDPGLQLVCLAAFCSKIFIVLSGFTKIKFDIGPLDWNRFEAAAPEFVPE